MKFMNMAAALLASTACVALGSAAQAALPRFPQPFGDRIVFVAESGPRAHRIKRLSRDA